jgi:tetratricopeptide (TPR) repeat protein
MDRQHRRELKHDKFVDELGTLSSRARDNQRLLLTLTVALVVISAIVYGIFFYRSDRERKAQTALATAIDTNDSPLITPGQEIPGAKFKTDAEKTAAAEKQFKDVQAKYSGTDAADVADLYLSRFEASRGDTTGARKRLQDFVNDHPKSVLVGNVRYSLYQLRIENGEAPQVANELNAELAKPADAALPPDTILVLLAHAYDAQGNNDKSKETYRRITQEYPDSPYATEAVRRAGPA